MHKDSVFISGPSLQVWGPKSHHCLVTSSIYKSSISLQEISREIIWLRNPQIVEEEKRPREAKRLIRGHSYLLDRDVIGPKLPTICRVLCTAELTVQESSYSRVKCRNYMETHRSITKHSSSSYYVPRTRL